MPRRFPSRLFPLLLATGVLLRPALVQAGDAFVLLSGGGSPVSNEYSQYLQAQAMSRFLLGRYPPEAVWIFFGAGNRTDAAPILADVHRRTVRDGNGVDEWLPGVLPRNRPATRESFLPALNEEILPAVKDGGTLFLFVGDHGSRGPSPHDTLITLWQLKADFPGDRGEVLKVSELRSALSAGLGAGRVLFCMTQCFSGGFHYLSEPDEIKPQGSWMPVPKPADSPKAAEPPNGPEAAPPSQPVKAPSLPVAGFTSTDAESPAAGCYADPDSLWIGYERVFPEALLGEDLVSGKRQTSAAASFRDAHAAASLVDSTNDLPCSTSDYYLYNWALFLEGKSGSLRQEATGNETLRAALRAFYEAKDGRFHEFSDADYQGKRAALSGELAALASQNELTSAFIRDSSQPQIQALFELKRTAVTQMDAQLARVKKEQADLWVNILRPAWRADLSEGGGSTLPPAAAAFEQKALEGEEKEKLRDFGASQFYLAFQYQLSGARNPLAIDPAKTLAVTSWLGSRREAIRNWAATSPAAQVRQAAAEWSTDGADTLENAKERALADTKTMHRIFFYRYVLAAWSFLEIVQETDALKRIHDLIRVEETPLPDASQP